MGDRNDVEPDARTGLIEMTLQECWERLDATSVGRVAVSVGTTPDIFPVNYFVHHGDVVIHTEAGTKLAAGTLMPALAFEIDEFDIENRKGWSVVVKGQGREPTLLTEIMALDEIAPDLWVSGPKTRWLIITPLEVTGRRVP